MQAQLAVPSSRRRREILNGRRQRFGGELLEATRLWTKAASHDTRGTALTPSKANNHRTQTHVDDTTRNGAQQSSNTHGT